MTTSHEVAEPILNSPFEEPSRYWHIVEGEQPVIREVRRLSMYYSAIRRSRANLAAHPTLLRLHRQDLLTSQPLRAQRRGAGGRLRSGR